MADAIRTLNWPATSLGPIENWPASLRFAVDIMLECAFPATLQWGGDLILFYNDSYVPLIGERHPSALGRPILDSFPEITATYRPLIERVWRGERVVLSDQLYRYSRHRAPEDLWFDLSYSPVHDEHGAVAGILAIGLETTPRILAERARSQTELRMRRVLETDAVGVLFFSSDGRVGDANDVFLHMTGYTRADIRAGLHWRDMTPPEFVAASEAQMEKFAASGRIGPYEKEYILRDGSRRWFLFAGRDLGDGTIAEYCIDISDRKRTEEALLRSEKLASLGRLAASIAHEINNPLEAVTNLLYLTRQDPDLSAGSRRHLDLADAELRRVAHIARQCLGFYRETERPAPASVASILEASIDLLKGKIENREATIERQWDDGLTIATVPGDLRQVFSNLLSNALDAIPRGGCILIRAVLCRSRRRSSIRVTFADNGKGIGPAARRHIFDPFFTTKGSVGTGLGLWVSKQIIDKHGGTIRLRTRNHGSRTGTVFSIVLPEQVAEP